MTTHRSSLSSPSAALTAPMRTPITPASSPELQAALAAETDSNATLKAVLEAISQYSQRTDARLDSMAAAVDGVRDFVRDELNRLRDEWQRDYVLRREHTPQLEELKARVRTIEGWMMQQTQLVSTTTAHATGNADLLKMLLGAVVAAILARYFHLI